MNRKKISEFFINSLSYMAYGLFASLIISLILSQLSQISILNFLAKTDDNGISIISIIKSNYVVGGAIGASIAYGLKKDPLVIFSTVVAGAIGYQLGGPLGSYFASITGCLLGQLVSKKTFIDIVLTPIVTIMSAAILSILVGPSINKLMGSIGEFIEYSTSVQPLLMGIIISVIMGMALTAPISSAAICIMLNLSGLAAGAAAIGCCTQMVGFAVMSYKDNKLNGVLSIGIGTSMLQFGNIIKKPIIWLPTIITSAILGPLNTLLFKIANTPTGSGMGTSGLVGIFGAVDTFTNPKFVDYLFILGTHVLLPGVIVFIIYYIFLKTKLIVDGDLDINLK